MNNHTSAKPKSSSVNPVPLTQVPHLRLPHHVVIVTGSKSFDKPTSAALPSEEHTACLICSDQLDFKPSTVHGGHSPAFSDILKSPLLPSHWCILACLHRPWHNVCSLSHSPGQKSWIFHVSKIITTKVKYTVPSLAANLRFSLYPWKTVLCVSPVKVFSYCPNILSKRC